VRAAAVANPFATRAGKRARRSSAASGGAARIPRAALHFAHARCERLHKGLRKAAEGIDWREPRAGTACAFA
jgi:hypothetical protein